MTLLSPRVPSGAYMSLDKVRKGKQERSLRVLLYGPPGVGKSSFAADAPSPIFLCSEDGTAHLDVESFPPPRSWSDVLFAVDQLAKEAHGYKTFVIDTLDWLQPICWSHVAGTHGKSTIDDIAYGKGHAIALEEFRLFLRKLDLLSDKGMHVVFLAHGQIRRIDDPQMGAYDKWCIKLHTKTCDVFQEWVDAFLFARHEASVVREKGSLKGRGVSSGARVMYTEWTASYEAKNRFRLPTKLPLSWEALYKNVYKKDDRECVDLQESVRELIPRLKEGQDRALESLKKFSNQPEKLTLLLNRVRYAIEQQEMSDTEEVAKS